MTHHETHGAHCACHSCKPPSVSEFRWYGAVIVGASELARAIDRELERALMAGRLAAVRGR